MEDGQVRRALNRGCDRDAVMNVLDVSQRSTFYKVKRACAYEFPLDAFSRGGRPAADTPEQETNREPDSDEADAQQRLDDVANDDVDDVGRTETWGGEDTDAGDRVAETAILLSELAGEDESRELGDRLQQEVDAAIETLEASRRE